MVDVGLVLRLPEHLQQLQMAPRRGDQKGGEAELHMYEDMCIRGEHEAFPFDQQACNWSSMAKPCIDAATMRASRMVNLNPD